jgi:hypothetical protein
VKRLNHEYFGVRVFIGRGGVGHSNGTAIRWKRSVLWRFLYSEAVGYPHLYNYIVSHEYQTFIFLVSFGVVACAWRRSEH